MNYLPIFLNKTHHIQALNAEYETYETPPICVSLTRKREITTHQKKKETPTLEA